MRQMILRMVAKTVHYPLDVEDIDVSTLLGGLYEP